MKHHIGLRIGESEADETLVALCVPRSYLPALRSLLTLMTRGRTWDERTGNVRAAQRVGVRIVDSMSACDLTQLINTLSSGFNSIENAIRAINSLNIVNRIETCCSAPPSSVIETLPDQGTPPDVPTDPENNSCRYGSALVAAMVFKLEQIRDLCTLPAIPHEELRRRLEGLGIPDDVRPIAWVTLFIYNRLVALINMLRLMSDPNQLYNDIYHAFNDIIERVTALKLDFSCAFQQSLPQDVGDRIRQRLEALKSDVGPLKAIVIDILIQMYTDDVIGHLMSLPTAILERYECVPCFNFGALRLRPLPQNVYVLPENNSTSTIERLSDTRFRTVTNHLIQPVHLQYEELNQSTIGLLYLWRQAASGITVVQGNPANVSPMTFEFNTPRNVLASTIPLRAHPDYNLIRDYAHLEFPMNLQYCPYRALSVRRGNAVGTFELDIYEVYTDGQS